MRETVPHGQLTADFYGTPLKNNNADCDIIVKYSDK